MDTQNVKKEILTISERVGVFRRLLRMVNPKLDDESKRRLDLKVAMVERFLSQPSKSVYNRQLFTILREGPKLIILTEFDDSLGMTSEDALQLVEEIAGLFPQFNSQSKIEFVNGWEWIEAIPHEIAEYYTSVPTEAFKHRVVLKAIQTMHGGLALGYSGYTDTLYCKRYG